MEESQKRQVAFKVRIKDIIDGKYIVEEGWQPNYIITCSGEKISRVNIIGTIVLKSDEENLNYKSVVLDDGTGKISIRSFEEKTPLLHFNIGDTVLLIGKPREYGQERYVVPEIVRKIENKDWVELRKLELGSGEKASNATSEKAINNEEYSETKEKPITADDKIKELPEKINITQKVVDLINELDNGNGADTQELINKCNTEETENIIKNLLKQGEIFEIKPGKLKILE